MHIPEYSQIMSPLYLVTRKKNNFYRSPKQQQAFAQIKQEIAHAVALSPVKTRPKDMGERLMDILEIEYDEEIAGNYTRAEGQAGFEPLVLEQCQQTGMAALVQTLQLATPQQSFATIVQGVDEYFLCFAGRLTAVVEKQVSDTAARKLMLQSLA
ncbi:hypothetical protein DUI87_02054 [Hirundo rustica rustica]|uniref:Reverse transcriptase/retrotransposon-derived protein RNase H-like domain-containing protein n=1 Tax=Hirundo rustica rustica TaxID=333673 RepID=A0A3M0L891_HIRRU|nr:hypothetical protein DUI87_02054 [Hirundo rustica rustica]